MPSSRIPPHALSESLQMTLDLAVMLADNLARLAIADPDFAAEWLTQTAIAEGQASYLRAALRLAAEREQGQGRTVRR
jgi:hypothetical protein